MFNELFARSLLFLSSQVQCWKFAEKMNQWLFCLWNIATAQQMDREIQNVLKYLLDSSFIVVRLVYNKVDDRAQSLGEALPLILFLASIITQ